MLGMLICHHPQRQQQQPLHMPLLQGMPDRATITSVTCTYLRSSVSMNVSTVTTTPSEHPPSSPTSLQSAYAQAANRTHLSTGAIIGLVIGLISACVLLFAIVLLNYRRRRFKRASQRFVTIDDMVDESRPRTHAIQELAGRDKKRPETSQAAPAILLVPADEAIGGSSSQQFVSRPDHSSESRTAADTDGNPYNLRVTTDSVSSAFGSGKGKSRMSNSETPISAATTLVSSSSSPRLQSRWERPSLTDTNTSPTRTMLRPDSAL